MTETFQPGPHLSPDQLSALAENVLPEHERAATLMHLAGCSVCRDAIFLTQQADPAPIAPPSAAETPRRGWFTFAQLFGAATAALACSLILALIVHHRYQEASTPTTPVTTAKVEQQQAVAPAPVASTPNASAPAPAVAGAAHLSVAATRPSLAAPATPAPKPVPQPTLAPPSTVGAIGAGIATGQSAAEAKQKDKHIYGGFDGFSAPAASTYAAVPPKAPAHIQGAYPMPAAPPPEFRMRQADSGASKSESGKSMSETVTVTAAAPAVNASDATVEVAADSLSTTSVQESALTGRALKRQAATAIQLPSNKPVAKVVRSTGRTLALDTTGNVFLSVDSGKRWTIVSPQWFGKAVTISLATTSARLYLQQPAQNQTQNQSNSSINGSVANNNSGQQQAPIPAAGFELTTSAGSVWYSTDGITWQPR